MGDTERDLSGSRKKPPVSVFDFLRRVSIKMSNIDILYILCRCVSMLYTYVLYLWNLVVFSLFR